MLKIKLTADPKSGKGVDFEKGYAAFFKGFEPYSFPIFLPESGNTTQIVHIETPEAGKENAARAVLVEGKNFEYTFANHSVSGTIETVRLTRLGDAYDTETGDLVVNKAGVVTKATEMISISGLGIANASGVKGEVHEIIKGFMGGGPDGTSIDPTAFSSHVWAEGHRVSGSTGNDTYRGTDFADIVSGGNGNDLLKGGGGRDKIVGGKGADTLFGNSGTDTLSGGDGADKLSGGLGADLLSGGAGNDRFIFRSVMEAHLDQITDFRDGDRIDLRGIDADTGARGNQAFDLIGAKGFSETAGELRSFTKGDKTLILGDVDGDGNADFRLVLLDATRLGGDDFLF